MQSDNKSPKAEIEAIEEILSLSNTGIWRLYPKDVSSLGPAYKIEFSSEIRNIYELKREDDVNSIDELYKGVSQDDLIKIKSRIESCISGEEDIYQSEFDFQLSSGKTIRIGSKGKKCREPDGTEYVLILDRDITDRKKLQEDIEESKKRIWAFADNIPGVVAFKDKEGKYVYVNRIYEEMIGKDWQGKTDYDYFSKEIAGQFKEHDRKVLRENEPIHYNEYSIHEGKKTYWSSYKFPYKDDYTNETYVAVIGLDITEHKLTEKILIENQSKLGLAFEAARIGYWQLNLENGSIEINDHYANMIGFDIEEMPSHFKDVLEMIHPHDRKIYGSLLSSFQYGNIRTFEAEFRMKTKSGYWKWIKAYAKFSTKQKIIGIHLDVDKYRRTELALMSSEEEYRGIMENSQLGIFKTDENMDLVIVNQALADIFEFYSPEDMITNDDAIRSYNAENWSKFNIELKQNGRIDDMEMQVMTANGNKKTLLVSAKKISDGYLGNLIDTTERKKIEDKLAESRMLYETLAESSFDFIFIIDRNKKVKYANKISSAIFGRDTSQLIGESIDNLFQGPILDQMWSNIKSVMETGNPQIEESKIPFPNKELWLHTQLIPFRKPDDEIDSVIGISRDFTKYKVTEQELRESRQTLRSMMNAINESVGMLDKEGTLLICNETFAKRLGKAPEQIIGLNIYDMLPEGIRHYRMKKVEEVFETGEPVSFEDIRNNINFYHSVYPIFNEKNEVVKVSIFGIDLTRIREYEQELIIKDNAINSSLAAFSIADLNGRVEFSNRTFLELIGYDNSEEIKGKDIRSFIDDKKIANIAYDLLQKNGKWRGELPIRKKDGSVVPVQIYASVVFDDNRKPIALTSSFLDLTELKIKERELRKLSKVFEDAVDPIIITDLKGNIIETNKRAVLLYEYEEEELTGHSLGRLFRKDDYEDFCRFFNSCLEGESVNNFEATRITQSGREIPVLINLSRLHDESGKAIAIASIETDITGLKMAQNALFESKNYLKQVISNVPVILFSIDENGIISLIEGKGLSAMNIKAGELIGESIDYFKKDHPEVFERIKSALSGKSSKISHKINETFFESLFEPIINEKDETAGAMVLSINITERVKYEEKMAKYNEELKRSNMELQQFAYIASHDLQEPLRGITSSLQIIERRLKDKLDDDTKQFMHFSIDGADRLKELITDLLSFSRVETSGKIFSAVDLNQVLKKVENSLKLKIEKNKAEIKYDSLPEIIGDETQMYQLFQNLIDNSIKFRSDAPPVITISFNSESDHYLFEVKDNGIGIDKEYYDKVFQIFKRLHGKEKYKGTGIGLAVCSRIISRHGGKIWLKSELDKGSAFYFTIPFGEKKNDQLQP